MYCSYTPSKVHVNKSREGATLPEVSASVVSVGEGGGEGGTPSEGEDSSRSQSQGRQGVSEEEGNGHPEPESGNWCSWYAIVHVLLFGKHDRYCNMCNTILYV